MEDSLLKLISPCLVQNSRIFYRKYFTSFVGYSFLSWKLLGEQKSFLSPSLLKGVTIRLFSPLEVIFITTYSSWTLRIREESLDQINSLSLKRLKAKKKDTKPFGEMREDTYIVWHEILFTPTKARSDDHILMMT